MSVRTLPRKIAIVYRRLPNDVREFPGTLRIATPGKLVIESPISVERPITFSGQTIADKDYLSIWFIYRNRWYDIGKFYDGNRTWIGYYCDIVQPVKRLLANVSRTTVLTDLFLDLWITPSGRASILDENELKEALANYKISKALAFQARKKAGFLLHEAIAGRFPPTEVRAMEPLTK